MELKLLIAEIGLYLATGEKDQVLRRFYRAVDIADEHDYVHHRFRLSQIERKIAQLF